MCVSAEVRGEAESGAGGTGSEPDSSDGFRSSDPGVENRSQFFGAGPGQAEPKAPTTGARPEGTREAAGKTDYTQIYFPYYFYIFEECRSTGKFNISGLLILKT